MLKTLEKAAQKPAFRSPSFLQAITLLVCAQFKNINESFAVASLRPPRLNALVADSSLYEVLAIQPGGQIGVREDFVGHDDSASAIRKYSAFLGVAAEEQNDIVLTPEYSCPWPVVNQALQTNTFPHFGKLWILACEAITPSALQMFIASHPEVQWIHEPIPSGNGRFLGVLAYLCRAESTDGVPKNVVALQFKTESMGGTTWERDHLIRGNAIYFWQNQDSPIRLISLLCADSLALNTSNNVQCDFATHPHVIFHPQLNLDPRHVQYSAYRGLYSRNVSEKVEIITLNWARGFQIPATSPSAYGCSTIYTKTPDFEYGDTRLAANHRKGMYFAYWYTHRTQLCILNFDEYLFRFRSPKLLQDVSAVAASRSGPEMLSLRTWDDVRDTWSESDFADDGFDSLCDSFQEEQCDYSTGQSNNAIDRERLLMLSSGNLPNLHDKLDWYDVRCLDSFRAESDERTKRLTFTHEQARDSVMYRLQYLQKFIELQRVVLANPENFPDCIYDLRSDWQLRPPHRREKFRYNLYSRTEEKPGATVIFLGAVPLEVVRRLRDEIVDAWQSPELHLPPRRLVIWYRAGNSYSCLESPLPTYNDSVESPVSFSRSSDP